MYQGTEHKMSISALCLHNQFMANTWSDRPCCFYICIDVEVRGGLYLKEIAQKGNTKRCPVKIADETPPEAPAA